MNLVRLRYADSPVFIDLPNITSQFEVSAGGSDPGPSGSQTNFGIGGPDGPRHADPELPPPPGAGDRQGAAEPPLGRPVQRGQRRGEARAALLDDPQRHQRRAERGPGHDPGPARPRRQRAVPPRRPAARGDRRPGRRRDRVLDERGRPRPPPTRSPRASSRGATCSDAAKDGYVFRAKGDGRMALYKREKELTLKIRARFTHSPEMEELARDLPPDPGPAAATRSSPSCSPTPRAARRARSPAGDTIYLNLRSILQIMTFLSKGVCVPEEHVADGDGADDPGARRPAVRLDPGHRRQLLRRLAEAPPARRRGGRAVPRLLVLHPPRRT